MALDFVPPAYALDALFHEVNNSLFEEMPMVKMFMDLLYNNKEKVYEMLKYWNAHGLIGGAPEDSIDETDGPIPEEKLKDKKIGQFLLTTMNQNPKAIAYLKKNGPEDLKKIFTKMDSLFLLDKEPVSQ